MTRLKAIVVDFDGTLCDHRHRLHFVDPEFDDDAVKEYEEVCRHGIPMDESKFRWFTSKGEQWKPNYEAYHLAMFEDTVVQSTHKLLWSIGKYHTILYVTSRPERFKDQVLDWLHQECDLPYGENALFMRPDFHPTDMELDLVETLHGTIPGLMYQPKPDHRPASVVKREIYEKHIRDHYEVLFAIDDCEDICEMWRSLGITTLKVGLA